MYFIFLLNYITEGKDVLFIPLHYLTALFTLHMTVLHTKPLRILHTLLEITICKQFTN